MKNKKILACLAVLALSTATLSITACGKDKVKEEVLSANQATEFTRTSAKKYFDAHKVDDANGFESATYVATNVTTTTTKVELDYKEAATDTATKKGTFDDVTTINSTATVYVERSGSGDAQSTNVKVDRRSVTTVTHNGVKADATLETTTTVTTGTETYTFFVNEGNYYLLKELSNKVDNNDPVQSKEYRQLTAEQYEHALEYMYDKINDRVKDTYYELLEEYTLFSIVYDASLVKKGDTTSLSVKIPGYNIDSSYVVFDTTMEASLKFVNNLPSEYSMTNSNVSDTGSMVNTATLNVTNGATVAAASLTDVTENTYMSYNISPFSMS